MYIEPNTIIRILKNVPLDNTYDHTIKFASLSAQQTYFSSSGVVKYTLNNQSYQRVKRGIMRIEVKAEDLYDCNYLAFQNTSFGTKWFYAFITSVEYVNNVTSEITFELDDYQTYQFDITVGSCFVEREHVTNDAIGANTVAEPIDCPACEVVSRRPVIFNRWRIALNYSPSFLNIIANGLSQFCDEVSLNIDGKIAQTTDIYAKGLLVLFKEMNSIVGSTASHLFPNNRGEIREHQYTGMIPYISSEISEGTGGNVQTVLDDLEQKIDLMNASGGTINSIYQVPTELIDGFDNSAYFDIEPEWYAPIDRFFYIDSRTPSYYIPKNNKLFTSPYTYMKVINKQGGEMNLAYEKIQTKKFKFYGSWQNGDVNVFMYLENYGTKGTDLQASEMLCRLPINNFPICNYNSNGLFSKLATMVGGLTRTIANQATYRPTITTGETTTSSKETVKHRQGRRVVSSFTKENTAKENREYSTERPQIQNYVEQLGDISNNFVGLVEHINSTPSSSGCDIANDKFGYEIQLMEITAEYAKIIDNFFEHFGYAVKLNKVPNMDTRPHWNYVKTSDCYITGNCPADSLANIIAMFNHGVTFWKNPSEVGNYNLNNH